MQDKLTFKTYECTVYAYGQEGNKVKLVVTDTSEQKIYNKFLKLGLIAKDFVKLNSTGE